MASPTLLLPFGTTKDEDWFNKAMGWERDDIIVWLGKVKDGTAGGDAVKDEATLATLKLVYKNIVDLSLPDGDGFKTPEPKCHILRNINPAYRDAKDEAAKKQLVPFDIAPWTEQYNFAGKPVQKMQYFTLYDFLGLFLSLLGPAPQGAGILNYFMPLTAVFGKWCGRLGALREQRTATDLGGARPYTTQCTARARDASGKMWFFLGASVAGFDFNGKPDETGRRSAGPLLQRRRFDVLRSAQNATMVREDDFDTIETQLKDPKANKPGNCAEALPFIHLMRQGVDANKDLYGLAIAKGFMNKNGPKEYTKEVEKIRKKLFNPCNTCRLLLQRAGAVETNFKVVEDDKLW